MIPSTAPVSLTTTRHRPLPMASGRQIVREIAADSHGQWGWLVAAVVVTLAGSVCELAIPMMTGRIIDRVGSGNAAIIGPAIVMAIATLAAGACNGGSQFLIPRYCATVLARLRERIVAHALRIDQQRLDDAGTADLIARAGDDVASVRETINALLPRLLTTGTLFMVSAGGLVALHPIFLWPIAATGCIFALAVHTFLKRAPEAFAHERVASTRQSQEILTTLQGLDAVRAFGLAPRHSQRIARDSWEAVGWAVRGRLITNRLVMTLLAGEVVCMVGVLACGWVIVTSGQASVGTVSAATMILIRIFAPLRFLLMSVDGLQASYVCLQRIVGVLQTPVRAPREPSDPADPADAAHPAYLGDPSDLVRMRQAAREGGVEIRDLTFAYDTTPVLHSVDLSIAPGEHVVLVGATGAGKTTLACLIAGIISHEGPGRDASVFEVPSDVVYLSQEPHVLSGPLIDDLCLPLEAELPADERERRAREALEAVGATWVDDLPDGIHTRVGRLGYTVDPAQAQQLALARLSLTDARVVVVDEATAEAGSEGAAILDRAAQKVIEGRTALIIAHRLSQVRSADRVAVMEDGQITEIGTVEELLAADGHFAHLWKAWESPRHDPSGQH